VPLDLRDGTSDLRVSRDEAGWRLYGAFHRGDSLRAVAA
jgi:hypothetical protein